MLNSTSKVYTPELYKYKKGSLYFFIDPKSPNWISTNERGAAILENAHSNTPEDIALEYMKKFKTTFHVAWTDTCNMLNEAIIGGILSNEQITIPEYSGRKHHLNTKNLNEFWIHLNDNCNLKCSHCLVNSAPGCSDGLPLKDIVKIVDQTTKLGAKRYYITGGEPFLRDDLTTLIRYIVNNNAELVIMTNGTLIDQATINSLSEFDRKKLFFQISLDGTTKEINDSIRGAGFDKAVNAVKLLIEAGFDTSIASTVFNKNIKDITNMPKLASGLGCKSIHIMWPHYRGRAISSSSLAMPSTEDMMNILVQVKQNTDKYKIILDNYESVKNRVNRKAKIKFDLGNQCWDSLCLYTNGHIYPSAAFAGIARLDMGSAITEKVESIWKNNETGLMIREESLTSGPAFNSDPFKFILGGPDIEQSYFNSTHNGGDEDFLNNDLTYSLKKDLAKIIMFDISIASKRIHDSKRGDNRPTVYFCMSENATLCGDEAWNDETTVSTTHSNCVLSFDVEKPHRIVQNYYGKAAEKPQADLCCPVKYDPEVTSHIPQDVLDRFYGCGSPVMAASILPGETVLDLGSGGGIDCFIAAKKVGEKGNVIGVDMTDQMLKVARENKTKVIGNLGFDNIDFKKGYLEDIPVESNTVNLITSNCVINLSVNKKKVLEESYRVLTNGGRFVVSDIVSDKPLPSHIRVNKELWGECLSGALTEDEFIQFLETSGFYGIEVLSKTHWKDIEGYKFYSTTVRAFKQESNECIYEGKYAIYHGPFKSVMDEDGHIFNRQEPVEICSDTEIKLSRSPYSENFSIINGNSNEFTKSCSPDNSSGSCSLDNSSGSCC